ncbi:hypothetical protein ARAM_007046 [Aspergillus rambellii]|uniref:Ubiquitin interaction motif protein n=1 Tax=Aspergillus rambellii TaxID=308745 RepID=A0A0F8WPV8_9EURO|nr:hypothetical protein ARAM_007046 [Aspergillus rambellii]
MTSEPAEEAITSFISFTNTSREQAISFLKANDLDSNKAINAYFEDPTGPQLPSTAYQIEHTDAVPVSPTLVPLSRPPSALNLKDSTHPTELSPAQAPTQNSTAASSGNGLSLAEQEERQLQQAVAMSLNQNLGQQETGITNPSQTFGRATRDSYDEGAWAMTLFNSSAREIIISPDPTDRKRQENEPAFIRPSEDCLHLGGLLTILHSIPLAREALLYRSEVLSNYGHDPQWWNGQPINLPKIVTIHDAPEGDTDWDDIIHETQRLVAFLDSTTRSFGSADALASLKCLSKYDSDDGVSRFLELWQESAVRAAPGNQLATVFSSMAYKRLLSTYDTPIERQFFTLEPFVMQSHGQTLYDAWDITMWADSPGEELDDVWLEHVADVFTIKLSGSDTTKPVDVKIPAVFYPDRYLASCRDITRDYRAQRLRVDEEILKLQTLLDRFSANKSAAGLTSKDLLEKAAAAASTIIQPQAESNGVSTAEESNSKAPQLALELKALCQKIEDKLKQLEERKQSALETLRGYSQFLTEPSASPSEPPLRKYTLRGVCTEPHVTYVLKRTEPHGDGADSTPKLDEAYEWWRISFSLDDAKTRQAEKGQSTTASKNAGVIGYTARKVREIEVLQAAREESKTTLLVYASSNAMAVKEEPAPMPLQEFVNADNKTFETELQASEATENPMEDPGPGTWEQTVGTRPAYPSPSVNDDDSAARKVNVFDYQVSSFEDESGPGQEMQERGGRRPLLSRSPTATAQDSSPAWSQ